MRIASSPGNAKIMVTDVRLPNVSDIREGLVIRLAKRIALVCDASHAREDILRDCIGLSMQMELGHGEFALLLSEVEERLGFHLTPLSESVKAA